MVAILATITTSATPCPIFQHPHSLKEPRGSVERRILNIVPVTSLNLTSACSKTQWEKAHSGAGRVLPL